MALRPQLNIICNRCGKPRGLLTHTCVSNSSRKATVKPALSFGTCPRCKKPYGENPLGHLCSNKGDFKRRKAAAERRQRAAARKKRQQDKHDYQACADRDCPRPLCVAFKTGWKLGFDHGYQEGFDRGHAAGWAGGYVEGIAACPRAHA